jgi:hypothetical protein
LKSLLLSVALVAAAYAGSASAAAPVSVALKTPLAKHTQLVKGDTAWECGESQCQTTVVSIETDSWQACRALVRTVGPVTSYGTLDPKALAKCNGESAAK